jgi:hypothetical protein
MVAQPALAVAFLSLSCALGLKIGIYQYSLTGSLKRGFTALMLWTAVIGLAAGVIGFGCLLAGY